MVPKLKSPRLTQPADDLPHDTVSGLGLPETDKTYSPQYIAQ